LRPHATEPPAPPTPQGGGEDAPPPPTPLSFARQRSLAAVKRGVGELCRRRFRVLPLDSREPRDETVFNVGSMAGLNMTSHFSLWRNMLSFFVLAQYAFFLECRRE
jgi:hypothetical protein